MLGLRWQLLALLCAQLVQARSDMHVQSCAALEPAAYAETEAATIKGEAVAHRRARDELHESYVGEDLIWEAQCQ